MLNATLTFSRKFLVVSSSSNFSVLLDVSDPGIFLFVPSSPRYLSAS